MVHTPVYYGPHHCVLWSTPLSTTVHTPVYYGPHPCVLWSTPLCTMVHTPVYYGPHPCVLWSTPLCTIVLSNKKTVLFRTATLQKTDYIYANLANTCIWCVFVCVCVCVCVVCVCVCACVCVCVCVCTGNQVATTLCMIHINKVHVEDHHSLICCHISY